jgi:putative sigma-54 modulation protein
MPVECTGRQVAITQPLRTLAEEGIDRIARILGKITSAHVVLTAEKYRQIAEVTVKTRNCTLVALCESSANMESALREALVKAETQATRYKDRQRTRKRQPKVEKQLEETGVAGQCIRKQGGQSRQWQWNNQRQEPPATGHSRHRTFLPGARPDCGAPRGSLA